MNLAVIDWLIFLGLPVFLVIVAYRMKQYASTTADFLAGNRLAKRFLLTMAEGAIVLAAGGCLATWQTDYRVGFGARWWGIMSIPIALFLGLIGWVTYRYRQTRVVTMAQFFEVRYSKGFRILAGVICWISGVLNYGIFPALSANFFIYYCGLPEYFSIMGVTLSTYVTLVVTLMALALYFTFLGGQVTIIATDFFQGIFSNVVLLVLMAVLLIKFPLNDIFSGLLVAEPGKSMLDPFDTYKIKSFDPSYYVIAIVLMFLNRLAWQGGSGFFCSAKTPHEAKMAGVLGGFRLVFFTYALLLMPIVAYTIMHHPKYAQTAAQVTSMLNTIPNEQVRDQMITPMTMVTYMPTGLMGAFAAVILGTFIATNSSYLLSWGSILIQDVVLPVRNKPISTKGHILLLRLSIMSVALFAVLWSTLLSQKMDVWMYFAITGAIWLGGAGIVIVGGLYTTWGTTRGAYAALLSGSILAVTGILANYMGVSWVTSNKLLTGQWIYFWAVMCSVTMYVAFSLLGKRNKFDLDMLLHRGKYEIESDKAVGESNEPIKSRWQRFLGITTEFSKGDKIIYGISIGHAILLLTLFLSMTFVGLAVGMSAEQWGVYHKYILVFYMSASFVIAIWLGWGGIRDAMSFFRDLRIAKHDETDDGIVAGKTGKAQNQELETVKKS